MLYIYIAVTPEFFRMAGDFISSLNNNIFIGGYRLIYDTFPDRNVEKINTLKMKNLLYVAEGLTEGDLLLKLDIDMIIKTHPQKIFAVPGDVLVTTRHYKCKHHLNAGTVGYRINDKSLEFLRFFNHQLFCKSWVPFTDYQKRHNRQSDKVRWWDEQDLLCAMWESREKLPIDVNMADAGPHWNWCVEDNDIKKLNNPDAHIIHYKGDAQKKMMTECYDNNL